MNFVIRIHLFIITFICFTLYSFSQENTSINTAEQCFSDIESKQRYVDDLSNTLSENEAYNLPIGIKKNIGNTPITLAISNVRFSREYGEITLFAQLEFPQKQDNGKSKYLYFAAKNVKLSYDGDLIGDVKLSLLNDITLPLGNMGSLVFKGGFDSKSGRSTSETYVSLECNGNFKELSLDIDLELNRNIFKSLESKDEIVRSRIKTSIADLNDLLISVDIPSFEIRSIPNFIFDIQNATLDLSDYRNALSFHPNPQYFQKYFTLPEPNLWRGLYIENFSVTFPSMFNSKEGVVSTISASSLLIDEMGITGDIFGKNILDISIGDASGCPFSVTDFQLSLIANNISKFGFGGKIGIPLSKDSKPRPYQAIVSKDQYLFNVALGDTTNFSLFGKAKLNLLPSSYLQVAVKSGRFVPTAVLDGSMSLDIEGLKMEQLAFRRMTLSTVSPFFSVESMSYGGEVKLNGFPISISNIGFTSREDFVKLAFDLKLNLMNKRIAANSRLSLISEYIDNEFKFKGLSIDAIKLDNVRLAGFRLAGEIRLEKDHPIYGNYFGGDITAVFDGLSNALKVNVKSIFGRKDYRYWYVEGRADFKTGIPIGPVSLNGFVGGAYYRMSAIGGEGLSAYIPDDNASLGVKAGVSYSIGSKVAVNGDALFEMNYLKKGGIKNIRFYGSAKFMNPINITGDYLGKLGELHSKAQKKVKNVSDSYANKLPKGLNGSEIAKNVLPDFNLSGSVTAFLTMDYDFPSKTFDANFKVMVDAPGGLLRGTGNNNEAGWAQLYCSPQTWFIHIGKPSNPIGLKLGLGPISLSTESYFMLGDKLESPILDPNVSRILGITPQQADYMKLPERAALGKGVAFGSRFKFDTGDLKFLILYARFMAGAGFDIMLQDMSNYACKGSNSPIGMNGWYANGQCYAYLQGELGVRIKLLFIKKRIAIIKGSAATLLQARLPNPTWVGGYMAVKLNVLGGLVKANMKMKFSFGNACELVNINGDYSPLDFPIISDLTPLEEDTDVDVFLSPQATFNMDLDEPFEAQDDEGNSRTYRVKLEDFYIVDNNGKKLAGNIKKSKSMTALFESFEILPPYTDLMARVSVNFEELVNGTWKIVTQGGKPARESRDVSFKTGGAPNYIPLTNIEYCYPVIGQQNYFKGEATSGYIQLKKGQTYLFPDNFIYKSTFTIDSRPKLESGFTYNTNEKSISYSMPELKNSSSYELSFIASPQKSGREEKVSSKKTTTTSIKDEDGEAFSIDYMQQAAQKIIKDGQLKVLNYSFRTSRFNYFEQKMSSLNLTKGAIYVNSDVRVLYLKTRNRYEIFDQTDLIGNQYTTDKPLIYSEAILDDDYYNKNIKPLIYNEYPYSGITIQNRNVNELGVPPIHAFSIYDGYPNGSNGAATVMPIVYQLPFYYYKDYYELRNKAANMFDKGINMAPLLPLIRSQFPVIKEGNYKTKLKYIMPGNKQGSEKLIQYNYW